MTELSLVDLIANTKISSAALRQACELWHNLSGANLELINHTENATFLASLPNGEKKILRVHRLGYNTIEAINSELAWSLALREETELITPKPIPGKNGEWVQSAQLSSDATDRQYLVLFEFEEGREPQPSEDLSTAFVKLGRMAAITHNHVQNWQKPKGFERLKLDVG